MTSVQLWKLALSLSWRLAVIFLAVAALAVVTARVIFLATL